MKIVALLQNQWSYHPDSTRATMALCESRGRRHWAVARMLFAGCRTGRVLRLHLGESLCKQIIWENSTKEIGTYAEAKFAPDREHMKSVLRQHKPSVLLTFGRVAQIAVSHLEPSLLEGVTVISCPHPVERTSRALPVLAQIRRDLEFAEMRPNPHTQLVSFCNPQE